MSKKLIAAAITAASMSATTSFADGFDTSMFSVKGFGTLGVVHSSEDQADFVANVLQPNGAGLTHEWDAGVDSKLGAQLSANFTDKLSAVVQAISQHQFDNSWRPKIEWANVKYQFTSDLSARVGRIVLPAFLISDSRYVGYATPWVRTPAEIYSLSPITSSDGADITYRSQISGAVNTAQAYYGKSKAETPTGAKFKSNPGWGITDTVEVGALTLRAAYLSYDYEIDSDLDLLFGGIEQFGNSTAGTATGDAALAIVDKYPTDFRVTIATVGVNYDPGDWFVMGEFAKSSADSFTPDSNAWYSSAGYRVDKFTPYVTYAETKADKLSLDSALAAVLPAQLTSAVNAVLSGSRVSQRTTSIGVRWDFIPSADLKIQYDRVTLLDDTNGHLVNVSPSFQGGGSFNVISAAVDFVF